MCKNDSVTFLLYHEKSVLNYWIIFNIYTGIYRIMAVLKVETNISAK